MAGRQGERSVFMNGKLLPESNARISVLDRCFAYGDGLFETMRGYKGMVFALRAHLERLASSARCLKFRDVPSPSTISDAVAAVLKANRLSDAYIKIILSRGVGGSGPVLKGKCRPVLVVHAREFRGYPNELYRRGMKVVLVEQRVSCDAEIRKHKTCSYLENILARSEAVERGADEAILLSTDGTVLEGTASNLFIVEDGQVVTTPSTEPILSGITRAAVTKLCTQNGIPVIEQKFDLGRLYCAAEVFLTNSLMEVMPVTFVNDAPIGKGTPGKMCRRIRQLYASTVREAVTRFRSR